MKKTQTKNIENLLEKIITPICFDCIHNPFKFMDVFEWLYLCDSMFMMLVLCTLLWISVCKSILIWRATCLFWSLSYYLQIIFFPFWIFQILVFLVTVKIMAFTFLIVISCFLLVWLHTFRVFSLCDRSSVYLNPSCSASKWKVI